jgi:uncharacterized membrane protein YfcA
MSCDPLPWQGCARLASGVRVRRTWWGWGWTVDWQTVLVLALVGGALVAPVAAAVTSLWPSRATRWAALACLTMVAAAVALVGTLWWSEASREPPPGSSDEFVEYGDDSGVVIFMSAAIIFAGLVNLGGWAVANARAPEPSDHRRPPPRPTVGGSRS